MSQVMLDVSNGNVLAEGFADGARNFAERFIERVLALPTAPAARRGQRVDQELLASQFRIVRIGDAVNIGRPDSCLVQAEPDRFFGQDVSVIDRSGLRMFSARESLFLSGGHDAAIDDQGGGGLMEDA